MTSINLDNLKLFSAHAEVFPSAMPLTNVNSTLLRTRGGISKVVG